MEPSLLHSKRALWGLLALCFVAQFALAHHFFGFLTGDDVEVLAEAFRVATGFHYRAWDIRNLFVPDFVAAPPIWIGAKLGIGDPHALTLLATIPFALAFALTAWLVFKLAAQAGAPPLLAAALFALHWIPLGFGSTVYPRTIATLCIVAAVFAILRNAPLLAGALAAIAFADRYSEIVFLIPLMVLARKQALRVLAGFAITACVVVGLYDWLTWGQPFGSLLRFARLTLLEPDFASRVKYQGPFWYVTAMPRWLPLTLLPLLWRARAFWFVAFPLIVLSIPAHKELRYMHGLIPFIAIASAIGFTKIKRPVAVTLVAISIVWQLYGLHHFARKSMPAVLAAERLGHDAQVDTIVVSQFWAYGDRLYFTDRKSVIDVGTPPRIADLTRVAPGADAVCLYESQLTPDIAAVLEQIGFRQADVIRHRDARDVVIFRRAIT